MCGIVGAASQRDILPILIEGLKRLEYRGYDSAGVALLNEKNDIARTRVKGKVSELEKDLKGNPGGHVGIAHTRWATHGKPTPHNAHPQMSKEKIAIVHNGIIENHDVLREELRAQGFSFTSDTDTEVVAHLITSHLQQTGDLLKAVHEATKVLKGAYALGVLTNEGSGRLIAVKHGSPLIVGLGFNENFFASDTLALQPVTQRFINLQDGDIADVSFEAVQLYDKNLTAVTREEFSETITQDSSERGQYRHYMLKEIFEQPTAIRQTLEERLSDDHLLEEAFGAEAVKLFDRTHQVHIIACGTSYHAGLVAKYWIESLAGIPCSVEIASEYRYRNPVVRPGTLFVGISQSGETADTLAAIKQAKGAEYVGILSICNVAQSAMVRESDAVILTKAGREIGVASTKAFTTQLVALMMLTVLLGRRHELGEKQEGEIVKALSELPHRIEDILKLDDSIRILAERFADKEHTIFLGRGVHYPIALEGALKLKEISYIHADAYPAGELKHGPLALIDKHMPVVTLVPNNSLLEKTKSNLHEVSARGGELFVFAEEGTGVKGSETTAVLEMPKAQEITAAIIHTIPLQLLSYHVAVLKGTDVDQPRNLAKSVTVE